MVLIQYKMTHDELVTKTKLNYQTQSVSVNLRKGAMKKEAQFLPDCCGN